MNVAVCVLYHPGDPWRDNLWAYARARWVAHGYEPTTGRSTKGLYAARNDAARNAGDWQVALFADADIVLAHRSQADEAILRAAQGGYVACFDQIRYLARTGTEQALSGAPIGQADYEQAKIGIWEGAFAIGRDLWDELGGMDERFAGRRGQGTAFIHACSTLAHLERIPGVAFHLWHEHISHLQEPAEDLWPRYAAASGNPDEMRRLLER